MTSLHFQGETYNDDRIYVLHIARCTVSAGPDDTTVTTVYHENAPEGALWCLVTYRNTPRYPPTRVDHFASVEDARSYLERVEPTVRRISLGGRSPQEPLAFDAWTAWKLANGLKDYDYQSLYLPGGKNPKEFNYVEDSANQLEHIPKCGTASGWLECLVRRSISDVIIRAARRK